MAPRTEPSFQPAPASAMPRIATGLSVVYPAAFAAAYVLTKYLDEGIPIDYAIRSVAITVAAVGALAIVSAGIFRDVRRGALLSLLLVGLVASIHEPMLATLFAVAALLLALGRFPVVPGSNRGRVFDRLHSPLVTISLILLVVTVGQFVSRGQVALPAPASAAAAALSDLPVISDLPDIYVLLLDGYPRADVLEHVYGMDNAAFLNELADIGFAVSARSRSNYLSTELTLASMLNFRYLDALPPFDRYQDPMTTPRVDRWKALQENQAFKTLREHGYQTIAVGSGYRRVDLRSADRFVDSGDADIVELHMLADSALRDVIDALAPTWATGQVRSRVETNLAVLEQVAASDDPAPSFVFVHLMAPHSPAIFSSDGQTMPGRMEWLFHQPGPADDQQRHRSEYVESLQVLNDLVLDALRTLQRTTRREAVIVVLSDHGSRSRGNLAELTPTDIAERSASFLASFSPGRPGVLGDVVSPVNLLPALFDAYLGTSYGMQPDRLFDRQGNETLNPDRSPSP